MASLPPPPLPAASVRRSNSRSARAPAIPKSPQEEALEAKLNAMLLADDDEFSVASYLNLALARDSSPGKMAELALQLQMESQKCHNTIEQVGHELEATVLNKCQTDASRLQAGLAGLQQDAAQLLLESNDILNLEQDSKNAANPLQLLTTLHALSTNLALTKSILSAASSWDATVSTIPALLSPQQPDETGAEGATTTGTTTIANLHQAVQALTTLEQGARALRGLPGVEERHELLDAVRSKIESLLKPKLLQALQQHKSSTASAAAALQQVASMYLQLQKVETLQVEYVKARPATLHKSWFAYTISMSSTADDVAKPTFSEWLNEWYQSIISMLAEERRRSTAVFGPELAPEITAKVLEECFRPLLSSFASRLSSLCPHDEAVLPALTEDECQFAQVCSVYESTLRFLSMAYDYLLGSKAELVQSIYARITAPFAPYQHKFPLFEGTYSKLLSKSSSPMTSVEDWSAWSTTIFPLVESSLVRFELLTSGYHAREALAAMDETLANHLLALSTSVEVDLSKKHADESFDEQQVQSGLELLKSAGTVVKLVQSLEATCRSRLRSLSVGLRSADDIADSMSLVEVGALLATKVYGDEDRALMVSQLLRLSNEHEWSQTHLALKQLQGSCQSFVFDILYSVPRQGFSGMVRMPVWREQAPPSPSKFGDYAKLPQAYITQIGEHVLALVQALEPFASSRDDLQLANHVMMDVKKVCIGPWKDFLAASGTNSPIGAKDVMLASTFAGLTLGNSALIDEEEEDEDDDLAGDEAAAAQFCNEWLQAICSAVTGRLLERVLKLSRLSGEGCLHLEADISYLTNVFSALGITGHPHPLLGHFCSLMQMKPEQITERLDYLEESNEASTLLKAVEMRLANIRGIGLD